MGNFVGSGEWNMSTEFERDLREALNDSNETHKELLKIVSSLRESDLDVAKRGEWPVRVMVTHVAAADRGYVGQVRTLRDQKTPPLAPVTAPASVAEAVKQLEAAKQELLIAVQGVDEEPFYRLRNTGHGEHSVVSTLRDATLHKKEHVQQIRSTLARR